MGLINHPFQTSDVLSAPQLFHRCNIPVIVLGETGCGKTRLIEVLCELMKLQKPVGVIGTNMVLLQVSTCDVRIKLD